MNIINKLNALMINFLNTWILYLDKVWPLVGLLFGLCIVLAWLNRDNKSARFFSVIAFLALVFQPAFYFAIPYAAMQYAGVEFSLPSYHLWAFCIGSIGGIASVILIMRYFAPTIETIKHKLTKSSSVERNRKTDIREIGVQI